MKETCACKATLEIKDLETWTTKGLLEVFKDWREHHRHDMTENRDTDAGSGFPDNPPLIDETSSSHERAEQRFPLGFMAEPEEGWH